MNQSDIPEDKEASYRNIMKPQQMEVLKKRILEKLVAKKKYRDSNYTARQLAEDLQTNVRYISAIIRVHFHTNYVTFVNKLRVEKAMSLLTDQQHKERSIEEIGDMVGFSHRQTFHATFLKLASTTPKAYRIQHKHQEPLTHQEETKEPKHKQS